MNRLLNIALSKRILCSAAAVVVFLPAPADAREPHNDEVLLCAESKYLTDGNKNSGLILGLQPKQKQMQFVLSSDKNKVLKTWLDRISSLKLGKSVGILVQTKTEFMVLLTSTPQLDARFDNKIYNVILFNKTGRSYPDGVSLSQYSSTQAQSAASNYRRFIPSYTKAVTYYNSMPGILPKLLGVRWMRIYGTDTVVKLRTKAGAELTFVKKSKSQEIDLGVAVGLDNIKWFDVLDGSINRSPGLPSPGVPGPSDPKAKPGDLSGLWHSNLGDVHFKHTGNSLNGDVSFPGNAKSLIFGNVTKDTVTFNWLITPLLFGNGELKIAADRKSMTGWYREFKTTAKQNWKLWR